MRDVVVIGVPPGGLAALGGSEREALAAAAVVAGGKRLLDGLEPLEVGAERIEIGGDLAAVVESLRSARPRGLVVLATGDPGFFGIGRVLADRFGPDALDVRPAVSSVATAFARLGLPWDDAVVVSAHGRLLSEAVSRLRGLAKAAVLTSPDHPPEAIGAALLAAGITYDRAVVASELGGAGEAVREGDLAWLAAGTFPATSVVVLFGGTGVASRAAVANAPEPAGARFGREEDAYERRDGMITKAEVRAVVLSKLALPVSGTLWDVGSGSGSVAVEAASLAPGLRVIAVDRSEEAADSIANASSFRVAVEVVTGEAPAVLDDLPSPERAVVGGGGLDVLDAVLDRLAPGGRVVATYASLARAAAAGERLGNVVQLAVSRGRRLPDGTLRLASLDPVFVCFGP